MLRCLNDYESLGLCCTEALELPWKYPPSFIKDWVKLTGSKCLICGSRAGSFQQAENTYMQSDFSCTAKQWWRAGSVRMCISLPQSLDTQCGLPMPAQFAQFAKREGKMDLLAKSLLGNETQSTPDSLRSFS